MHSTERLSKISDTVNRGRIRIDKSLHWAHCQIVVSNMGSTYLSFTNQRAIHDMEKPPKVTHVENSHQD